MEVPPQPASRLTRRSGRRSPSSATPGLLPKRQRLAESEPKLLTAQIERIRRSLEAIDMLPQAAPTLRLSASFRARVRRGTSSAAAPSPRASTARQPRAALSAFPPHRLSLSRAPVDHAHSAGPGEAGVTAHIDLIPPTSSDQVSASSSPLPRIPRRPSPLLPECLSASRGPASADTPGSAAGSLSGPSSLARGKSSPEPKSARWMSPAYCQVQFEMYRTSAHGLKKRADGLAKQAGGVRGRHLEVAQVMWTDSLLLYAYASWARDQRLRFKHDLTASPSEEQAGAQEIQMPQPLEQSTCHRGVKDWLELQPLLAHVTHQLRKTPTVHTRVLEAVLQTLRARILLLSAAYRQGSASRRITAIAQARDAECSSTASPNSEEALSASALELAAALKDTDRSWASENQARASFNPMALQEHFPHTWSALTMLASDRKASADHTLNLDPASLPQLDSQGFAFGHAAASRPVFPIPQGPDAPAHLVLLGRLLIAEMSQTLGLDYDPVPVIPTSQAGSAG